MAAIQKQKSIPEHLASAVQLLLEAAHEIQQDGGNMTHEFEVRDSSGLLVCKQTVTLDKASLDVMDKQIDDGFL